jgi:bisanhydrobacterioruberin hydratase
MQFTLIISRTGVAVFLALLFHVSGAIGITGSNKDWFLQQTPVNLMLMSLLLIWTQKEKNKWFWLFCLLCIIVGFAAEWMGVNTGKLFGNYSYGETLGQKWQGVPFLIGLLWFVTMYCAGNITFRVYQWMLEKTGVNTNTKLSIMIMALALDAAMLITIFDWLLEPVAVKLGYWQWLGNGEIPMYNYICWFFISLVLQLVFFVSGKSIQKPNYFAVHLFIIQVLFFLFLRTRL